MNKIVKIKRIGVVSAAKIYGLITAGLGLIFGVIYGLIIFIVGSLPSTEFSDIGISGGLGIFMVLMFPILYGAIGFIMGAIMALIYNFIASKLGGLEVGVDE
ncbi:hypothetical protein [Peijinzhouia sedimentorum]